ncbi:MAG TPA: MarR family transcriptional regulator [Rhizomicrobium sp.]|nr:MarR family transcriptional regulator [Rhizomicrobium sp.]
MTDSNARTAALAEALRSFIGNFKRRLRAQSPAGELSWSQFGMLSRLERDGPSTVTALAKAEGMRPQSMGATIRDFEAAGHVTGTPDPQDGRQTLWSVTPKARALVQVARAARQDWLLAAIQKNYSPEEQHDLIRAVKLLERIVE